MAETKEYIVYQNTVKRTYMGSDVNIDVDCIIRYVHATSQEEAIGRFICATMQVESASQKLTPVCLESKHLLRVGETKVSLIH